MADRKRFSRSGHTVHGQPTAPLDYPPPPPGDTRQLPPVPPPAYPPYQPPPPAYQSPAYQSPSYPPPSYPTAEPGFGDPTYHSGAHGVRAPGPAGKQSVTRIVVGRTVRGARYVTARVKSASEADGARESGLTALIWNQVLSYGTDAMITVALAGTVFFGASAHAQRGNVLLYLLVTMAPFAVIAPVIGPALDRVQHGRRWAMAASSIGRGVLALLMAAHSSDLLVLYPCALGSLVFSKGYSVIRGAAAPRIVPPGLTLVEANARLSIFGLGAALVGGGVVGALIKVTGSYSLGLVVTAIAFFVGGYSAFRLPKQVDSSSPARRDAGGIRRPAGEPRQPFLLRLLNWARRGFVPAVITSMQGVSALRFLSGFLAIYLAFYIEAHAHGFTAALDLGAIGLAAGAGNFAGTGIGSRLKMSRPELLVMISIASAATVTVVAAALFSLTLAVAAMFISAVGNSLAKVALDAVIQRDVAEELRSSAFGRSETFLQLAWVFGAAIGVLLPSGNGTLAFAIVGGAAAAVTAIILLRHRAMGRSVPGRATGPTAGDPYPPPDGNVGPYRPTRPHP